MTYLLTTKQLQPIVGSYLKKQPNGTLGNIFAVLKSIHITYQQTGDIDDLRYLLALGIRCRHGRRMPWVGTHVAVSRLISIKILDLSFTDFEALYDYLEQLLGDITFVRGELTLYDTAVNIGQLLTPVVVPQSYVYLASGAREGAGYILGNRNVKRTMPASIFSPILPGVQNIDIENMLCIYKSLFKKLSEGKTLSPLEIDQEYNPHGFNPRSKKEYIARLNSIIIP